MDVVGFIALYLLIINIAGFAAMGVDKQKARKQQWRIPEKRLFLCGLIGGALGVWLGMRIWHHKTKHRSFTVGIPLLFVFNLFLFSAIIRLGL